MSKQLVSIFLFVFMVFIRIPGNAMLQAEDKHIIAGYGPVYGNLVNPIACKIINDTIFVLDSYGISSFSLPDNQFIARYKVDLGDPLSDKAMRDPYKWAYATEYYTDVFSIVHDLLMDYKFRISTPFQVIKTIEKDSSNDLYISAINGITHLNRAGEMIQLIRYPKEIITTEENEKTIVMFTMAGDKIYLLVQYEYQPLHYDEEFYSNQTIYVLNIDGKVLNKIKLKTDDQIDPEFYCFKFLQNKHLFLMTGSDVWGSVYLFNEEGSLCYSFIIENLSFFNYPLDLITEDTIVCLTRIYNGFDSIVGQTNEHFSSYYNEIKQGRLLFQEKELTVEWEESWKHENWGEMGLSITASPQRIGFITEGKSDSVLDFQVNIVDLPDNYYTIGKPTNGDGQVNKSLTYTIDEEGNLYTTNIGTKTINVFSPTGEFLNTIEIDKSFVSTFKGIHGVVFENAPMITDMCIESDSLYIANSGPTTVSCYNLETKEWKSICNNDSFDFSFLPRWIDMHVVGNDIYLLDPYADENGIPRLFKITKDLEISPVVFPPRFSNDSMKFYAGFEIDDQHLYLLDGLSCKIQEWNFPDLNKKRTILLENMNDTFYTSFCLLDSGDLILADPFHDQIIRINKKGKIIRKWGKRTPLAIGREKEVYQTNLNGLNLPFRVKEQNNILYISDFMNYRYHIMSTPLPAPKVTLTDFVGLKDISVFRDHEQTIEIAIESEFLAHFQVKTDQDWIQIKEPAFTSDTKELHITLLGSKMKPWTNHYGYLHISCDEADLNNQNKITVDISVDTVGKKMMIDLNTNSANIDGKTIQLPADQYPIVENGRAFLPFRFISESLFEASVQWDNTNQEVTIITNQHILKLKIGSKSAWLDGKEIIMDVAPFIRNSRVFVPLRFLGESFGAKVDYDNATRKITILYPAPET